MAKLGYKAAAAADIYKVLSTPAGPEIVKAAVAIASINSAGEGDDARADRIGKMLHRMISRALDSAEA